MFPRYIFCSRILRLNVAWNRIRKLNVYSTGLFSLIDSLVTAALRRTEVQMGNMPTALRLYCKMGRICAVLLLILVCYVTSGMSAFHRSPREIAMSRNAMKRYRMAHTRDRGLIADLDRLVEDDPLILSYHNGPVLSGDSILVYVIYYGNFTSTQRSMISDFLNSFQSHEVPSPSVADWWGLTVEYRDSRDEPVSEAVQLGGERSDNTYSKGKTLKIRDIEDLILGQLRNRKFPTNHKGIYMVLTSHDVEVEDFCKNQCASHFATKPLDATDGRHLVYGWAGNAIKQCPSRCVWPFAKAEYGPRTQQPLKPPNQDAGIDGMIINIAEMIAGAATNPFNSGYYQGDAAAPLEAATACAGIFGEGAYPGEPGKLLVDQKSGGSFNAHGIRNRQFMLPALWNPLDLQCTPPQSANNEKKND